MVVAEAEKVAAGAGAGASVGDAPKAKRGRKPRAEGAAKVARTGIYFQAPDVLRARIDTEAAAAGKTPAVYVRDMLAGLWGITLPPARTRHKYATDEERKAAQVKQRTQRADLIKLALAEYARLHPDAFAGTGSAA